MESQLHFSDNFKLQKDAQKLLLSSQLQLKYFRFFF